MTLILGILCSDGAVLGADGAATFGSLGDHTIRQPTKKIHVIADCLAVATSGFVGLSQRLVSEVDTAWARGDLKGKTAPEAMTILRNAFWKIIEPEFAAASKAMPVVGAQVAQSSALALSIVGIPLKKETCLIHFDHQAAPEQVTKQLPFVAYGSGQRIADPFLAFIRRVFWGDRLPTLAEGRLAAFWTLRHAIDTHPGGVADPVQIVVLRKSSSGTAGCQAQELSENDLLEHREALAEAEKTMKSWWDVTHGAAAGPPPSPPPAVPDPSKGG